MHIYYRKLSYAHDTRLDMKYNTSAWYSYLSAAAEEEDSAAVDSYRLPKNKSLFKFEESNVDLSELIIENHLAALVSFSPACDCDCNSRTSVSYTT